MKFLRTAILATLVSATFIACSKDDKATPVFTMEGIWEGKIGENSDAPSGQYKLNIKQGGAVDRVGSNGSVSASGTWQLEGNVFSATYSYSNGTVVVVEGTVDKGNNKITAEWSNNGGEVGTLYANKQ